MSYSSRQQEAIIRRAAQVGITENDLSQIAEAVAGNSSWENFSNAHGKPEFEDALEAAIAARTATVETITTTPQSHAAAQHSVTPMATERQVDYIVKLLVRAAGWGLEPRLERLMSQGNPNRQAIASLTRREASQTIELLKEQY